MSKNISIEEQYIIELNRDSYRAFDALYSMYSRRLYAFVLKLTKSPSTAHDIVQDVFVKIWTNRRNIQIDTSFQSYVFTIAKNMVISKIRANVNSPTFVDYVSYLNERGLSEENIAEQTLNYDDFRVQLTKAKEQLHGKQRIIFEFSKELGYTNEEIATRLELSEQTVKNQLSIAMKTMRKGMKRFSVLFILFFP